jgi:hypothetical protein
MDDLNEYVEKLELFIPEFREYWDSDEGCNNHGDQSTVHSVFNAFSGLVISKLETGTLKNGQRLFDYIESVVDAGGDPANAAYTCFLENILNVTPESIDPKSFVSLLGPNSREFCRGWDDFTGVKTAGL